MTGDWPAGITIRVEGTVASRFSQRTFRIAEADITGGPVAPLPDACPDRDRSGDRGGRRHSCDRLGTVVGAPDQLTDGLGVTIDDGSGPVRPSIGPDAASDMAIGSGMLATVTGPLGQRDSTGTGSAGYRIQSTLPGEFEIAAEPDPDAHRSLESDPDPPATTTPAPTATATRDPDPTTDPDPDSHAHRPRRQALTPSPTPSGASHRSITLAQ